MPQNILFICTGNTCRSPMAEHLFRHRCNGKLDVSISSAGISAWPGSCATPQAIAVMQELGIDIRDHASQSLTAEMIDANDLIVVMTCAHRDAVCSLFPKAADKIYLLHSFGTEKTVRDVVDPFGLSIAAYRKTREEIDGALSDLIIYLNERRNP